MNYFVNSIRFEDDSIFGLFEDGKPIGAGILMNKDCPQDYLELSYFYIAEDKRGKGYGKFLVQKMCDDAKQIGKIGLSARLATSNTSLDCVKHLFALHEFQFTNTAHIYQCKIDEPSQQIWLNMIDKKYQRIYNWVKRKGFSCTSFEKVDCDMVKKAYDKNAGFDTKYNLSFIDSGGRGVFMKEYSYLAEKGGQPAAVVMVTKPDTDSLVYQLISVAEKFRNTGAVLLPVIDSISLAYQSTFKSAYFCIYSDNISMINMADEIFMPLTDRKTKQLCYMNKWSE
jgi:GNAT superfamily N-acetyltransferase